MSRHESTALRQELNSYLQSLTEHDLELCLEHLGLCGNCGDLRHLYGFPSDLPREQIPPLYSYETMLARNIRERWRINPITNLDLSDFVINRKFLNSQSQGRLLAVLFAYWIDLPKEQIRQIENAEKCRYPFQFLRYFLYDSESKDEEQLSLCPYSGKCIYSAETYFVFKPPAFDEKTAHLVNGFLVIDDTGETMNVFGL